ncbi:MAG: hypothetical protein QF441_01870 [Bacteriovoracaceae bacterium]|jgi:hypothetical protein|nr:hypothetical protein [Halobacteriovoraceae bacterium]MDP7319320.1 hypothetical protein [Bacteriovoracaceae bacterium]|tara:strand:- start:261 stop:440 length:180 start_codon:yes stop_codon:yes gene_type:complete
MLIKILYLTLIFLAVRLVMNHLKKFNQLQNQVKNSKKSKQKDDDIIDAQYTVVDDDKKN